MLALCLMLLGAYYAKKLYQHNWPGPTQNVCTYTFIHIIHTYTNITSLQNDYVAVYVVAI